MSEVIRVFCGTEPKTALACKVLEHSIRSRTRSEVQFVSMVGPDWEYSTEGFRQGTGFSLRRWMIPKACNWQGRAIYLDADQTVLGDIAELWAYPDLLPSPGCSTWMTLQPDKFNKRPWPQSSVMVIDCSEARGEWGWDINQACHFLKKSPDRSSYINFMHADWLSQKPQQIPTTWNHLNEYSPGETKLLHYTKEDAQCWYKPDHPLAYLWKEELTKAIEAKAVTEKEFRDALALWKAPRLDSRKMQGLHPSYAKWLRYFS